MGEKTSFFRDESSRTVTNANHGHESMAVDTRRIEEQFDEMSRLNPIAHISESITRFKLSRYDLVKLEDHDCK